MEMSLKELWTVLHGMGFGAVYLLAFAGGLAGLYSFRPELVTPLGDVERAGRLKIGMWIMAAVAWFTVISGTWVVYIECWTDLTQLCRSPARLPWHGFERVKTARADSGTFHCRKSSRGGRRMHRRPVSRCS